MDVTRPNAGSSPAPAWHKEGLGGQRAEFSSIPIAPGKLISNRANSVLPPSGDGLHGLNQGGCMKTIREAKLDKLDLRLVENDKLFIGIIIANGTKKVQIEGDSADDVWRRLHDEAGKVNPKYFGFDGARARFLHWL
jgi:hypothetical protein